MPNPAKTLALPSALIALAILAGCNFPAPEPTPDVLATSAAQTVSAALTEAAAAVTPTPPEPTETPTPPATDTPLPPTATATEACSDRAGFVTDVTIPDNTNLAAGSAFEKVWRLRNDGTCTWGPGYNVVFVDGNIMGGPASFALPGTVPSGATVDVRVNLTAPSTNGTFRGNWSLRNDKGVLFATRFYVQIVVGPTPTATVGTYRTGKFTVNQTFHGDLDQGAQVSSGVDADFWFHAVSVVEKYIEPQNGALMLKWATGAPSFNDCKAAALSSSAIPYGSVNVGDFFCYKTAQGRFGRFEVEGKTDSSITLDYRTWQ